MRALTSSRSSGLTYLLRSVSRTKSRPSSMTSWIGGGAVFAEQELDDEHRDAVGAAHAAQEVLAHDQSGEGQCGLLVYSVQ